MRHRFRGPTTLLRSGIGFLPDLDRNSDTVSGFLVPGLAQPTIDEPPPPPPAKPANNSNEPIRVGGEVASAKLIQRVQPAYPPIARQARVQGPVKLEAVISETGEIVNLRVISGHPLLMNAALEAVAQWRYSPTLLNGTAVAVITTIEVNFRLASN
jgi:periplasmic protein TonB